MVSRSAQKKGFTLIELIIVIAIIAIIVAAVFVAMDPVKRLNASRNSTRNTDITAIAQAIQLFKTDVITGGGNIPTGSGAVGAITDNVSTTWQQIGTDTTGCATLTSQQLANCPGMVISSACRNLGAVALTGGTTLYRLVPSYLPVVPRDPGGTAGKTMYFINEANGQAIVRACNVQGEGAGGAGPTPPAIPMEVSR